MDQYQFPISLLIKIWLKKWKSGRKNSTQPRLRAGRSRSGEKAFYSFIESCTYWEKIWGNFVATFRNCFKELVSSSIEIWVLQFIIQRDNKKKFWKKYTQRGSAEFDKYVRCRTILAVPENTYEVMNFSETFVKFPWNALVWRQCVWPTLKTKTVKPRWLDTDQTPF